MQFVFCQVFPIKAYAGYLSNILQALTRLEETNCQQQQYTCCLNNDGKLEDPETQD